MMRCKCAWLLVIGIVAGCGDDSSEPIVRMETRDLRAEQAREREPSIVMEPMRIALGQEPVIYDPPPDLTLQRGDSLLTAPFGVTAGPGARGASADTTTRPRADTAARARTDTTARPSQSTPAARDTAARRSPLR